MSFSQETKQKFRRFRRSKLAFLSLCALLVLYGLSLLSPWLVNDEPLAMKYSGKWYFPAFVQYSETDFGGAYRTEPDYQALIGRAKSSGAEGWALMPPVPRAPREACRSLEGTSP